MKSKPTKSTITQDGYEVRPGDTVYVTVNGGPFEEKVVAECYDKKIKYTEPDSGGYLGARFSAIFKYPDLFAWKLVQISCWHAPYWMNDCGSFWLNQNGGKTPKSAEDKVFDVGFGLFENLDHKKTGLVVKKSEAGWLSREARFFPCRPTEHETYADLILHTSGRKLEDRGWVRIYHRKDWHCAKDLSEEQEIWMSARGFDCDVYNPIASNRRGC